MVPRVGQGQVVALADEVPDGEGRALEQVEHLVAPNVRLIRGEHPLNDVERVEPLHLDVGRRALVETDLVDEVDLALGRPGAVGHHQAGVAATHVDVVAIGFVDAHLGAPEMPPAGDVVVQAVGGDGLTFGGGDRTFSTHSGRSFSKGRWTSVWLGRVRENGSELTA